MNRMVLLMLSLVLTVVAAERSRESEADSVREVIFKRLIYEQRPLRRATRSTSFP